MAKSGTGIPADLRRRLEEAQVEFKMVEAREITDAIAEEMAARRAGVPDGRRTRRAVAQRAEVSALTVAMLMYRSPSTGRPLACWNARTALTVAAS